MLLIAFAFGFVAVVVVAVVALVSLSYLIVCFVQQLLEQQLELNWVLI